MKPTVLLALFGWPLVAFLMFLVLRPRRAVIASVILGWLFLPVATYKIAAGVPEYTKMTATCLGALLGIAVFDTRRILSFRPGWFDLPMLIWCLCPFASSLSNDLGAYDGFSSIWYKTMAWGVPYFFGRLYCSDLVGIFELALGIFLGGLLYMPLCLLEVRMSPQLHNWVYGFHQHEFAQTIRFGGWRPTVFMEHGIMAAMWMSMASLVGIWLWTSKTLKKLFRIRLPWLVVPLLVTTVLCKSLGALLLLAGGLAVLAALRFEQARIYVVVALALVAPLYLALRIPKVWSGGDLTEASEMFSPERAQSLKFRLNNEDLLLKRAGMRPVFGWGAWGRARVRDEMGRDISVTDGLWIISIGNEGLVGLAGMLLVFVVPLAGLIRCFPTAAWRHPLVAPAVALCIVVLLFQVDCIFNYMNNPAYTIAAGGLASLRVGAVKRGRKPVIRSENVQWSPQS